MKHCHRWPSLLFASVLLSASPGQANEVYLGLRRAGFRPVPVGVPQFVVDDPQLRSLARDVRGVVLADMEFSVLVEPVSDPRRDLRRRFLAATEDLWDELGSAPPAEDIAGQTDLDVGPPPTELFTDAIGNPGAWTDAGIGIAALVRIQRDESTAVAAYEIHFLSGGPPITTGQLQLTSENTRFVAHSIADAAVEAASGEPGIARTRIAFTRKETDGNYRIYTTDYDGRNKFSVTAPEISSLLPSWSPDGDQIACIGYGSGGPDLRVHRSDGRDRQGKDLSATPGLESTPSWSPSGKDVAFTLTREGNADLFLLSPITGRLRRITWSRAIDTSPTWSPTGEHLAFTSDRTGGPNIYVMDRRGVGQRRLVSSHRYMDAPTWSPRGDRIAYVARHEGQFHIFTIDPLGGDPVQLTDRGDNESPHWSPDGLHLVFSSHRAGATNLYVMRLDGSAVRRIPGTRGAITPAWSMNPSIPTDVSP